MIAYIRQISLTLVTFAALQGTRSLDHGEFSLTYEHARRYDLPHHCIGVSQHDRRPLSSIRHSHLRSGRYPASGVLDLLLDVQCDQTRNKGEESRRRVCTPPTLGVAFPGPLTPFRPLLRFPAKVRSNTSRHGKRRSPDTVGLIRRICVFYPSLSPSLVISLNARRLLLLFHPSISWYYNPISTCTAHLQSHITTTKDRRGPYLINTIFLYISCRITVYNIDHYGHSLTRSSVAQDPGILP